MLGCLSLGLTVGHGFPHRNSKPINALVPMMWFFDWLSRGVSTFVYLDLQQWYILTMYIYILYLYMVYVHYHIPILAYVPIISYNIRIGICAASLWWSKNTLQASPSQMVTRLQVAADRNASCLDSLRFKQDGSTQADLDPQTQFCVSQKPAMIVMLDVSTELPAESTSFDTEALVPCSCWIILFILYPFALSGNSMGHRMCPPKLCFVWICSWISNWNFGNKAGGI